ncbi:uncharacterized protein (DUF302 family) [Breoghania corrubedonensis]|uniref:Uncharacterized protein (DUF302 family) n=1 Tax=Breoghania corrubedonensis TaxID=665038 RepID=A0A2T5VG89_9HYPH|nr:DUF302 domain-containing protein [Breoghania corrubedonensis]PTW62748.1 uncharacterized protein (DUF302 family) [Breoghania corrubedonensis]
MVCHIARKIDSPFDTVLQRTKDALKAEGLEVVSELDLKSIPAGSLGGREAPRSGEVSGDFAHTGARRLIMAQDETGVLLPCNIIIRQTEDGVEVSAIDPEEELSRIENGRSAELAKPVRDKLQSAFAAI